MALPIPAKFVMRDGTLRPNTGYPLDIPGRLPAINLARTPPDHWLNLPKRKCDYCGKSYQPSQPFKKGQKYGFCKREHKEAFHSRGSAFSQAADKLRNEIARQVRIYTLCPVCKGKRKTCEDCEGSGHVLTHYGQHLKKFIEYTVHETVLQFEKMRAIAKGA